MALESFLFQNENSMISSIVRAILGVILSSLDVNRSFATETTESYQYYYWKRKASYLPVGGSFLPINIQGSGLLGKGKGNKNTPPTYVAQGEMEIEVRTAGGAELRIRGFLDPVMVNTIIVSAERRGHV